MKEPSLWVCLAQFRHLLPKGAVRLTGGPATHEMTIPVFSNIVPVGSWFRTRISKHRLIHHKAPGLAGVVATSEPARRLTNKAPDGVWLRPLRIWMLGRQRIYLKA